MLNGLLFVLMTLSCNLFEIIHLIFNLDITNINNNSFNIKIIIMYKEVTTKSLT
jgi:hypothetical protein